MSHTAASFHPLKIQFIDFDANGEQSTKLYNSRPNLFYNFNIFETFVMKLFVFLLHFLLF